MTPQIITVICIVVGLVLVAGGALVCIVVAMLAAAWLKKAAEAKGVDFSDGIDAREMAIITGMVARVKQTEAERAVASTLQSAADLCKPTA
jgi:hypothetical protein